MGEWSIQVVQQLPVLSKEGIVIRSTPLFRGTQSQSCHQYSNNGINMLGSETTEFPQDVTNGMWPASLAETC